MKLIYNLSLIIVFMASCHSVPIDKSKNNRVYSSLTEYFQTIPGVQITGNDYNGTFKLTGMGTTTTNVSDTTPLFIVNGQQVGRSFSGLANILNPNDIKRVKVLRNADQTAFYGINGANGVIEITTKK